MNTETKKKIIKLITSDLDSNYDKRDEETKDQIFCIAADMYLRLNNNIPAEMSTGLAMRPPLSGYEKFKIVMNAKNAIDSIIVNAPLKLRKELDEIKKVYRHNRPSISEAESMIERDRRLGGTCDFSNKNEVRGTLSEADYKLLCDIINVKPDIDKSQGELIDMLVGRIDKLERNLAKLIYKLKNNHCIKIDDISE